MFDTGHFYPSTVLEIIHSKKMKSKYETLPFAKEYRHRKCLSMQIKYSAFLLCRAFTLIPKLVASGSVGGGHTSTLSPQMPVSHWTDQGSYILLFSLPPHPPPPLLPDKGSCHRIVVLSAALLLPRIGQGLRSQESRDPPIWSPKISRYWLFARWSGTSDLKL
jgi:hypothetical protein